MNLALLFAAIGLLGSWSPGAAQEESLAPHGSGAARAALSAPGYLWRTQSAPFLHLHYLPGAYTAQHIQELAPAAEDALRHDLALLGRASVSGPLEIFLVDSRAQAQQLTGNPYMGQAIPGELSAFFVVLPGRQPAFRHEIMHALTLARWGTHRTGSWLSEGVATWAAGTCQGKSVDAIAAGFLRRGTLRRLPALAAEFWQVDEVQAYMTAGSAVRFLARTQGRRAVEALWKQRAAALPHPLGRDGAQIEAAWRAHLASIPAVDLDTTMLREHGC